MVIEFPNPKELMAKRKAKKEAEKAAAAAAATSSANVQGNDPAPFPSLESSPEPPSKPVSSPAKKRKEVEKAKRKIPAKRSKRSKVATPEPNVEGPKVEVYLPPRLRLLQDKQTSVEIMNQLLSEADAEMLGQGSLHSHLDDLLWDGLKTNIRAMGLLNRTSDKMVERKARINELEAINKKLEEKDGRRREMLLNIERRFADMKMSADGLTADLKKIMYQAKEGTSMMEVMIDRFDEAQAKIKSLENENAELTTQILDAFEKATIKARYDLLKEYKQGLLVDAEVDEEIALYEEDNPDMIETSSSVPTLATTQPEPDVELPAHANPSDVLKEQQID